MLAIPIKFQYDIESETRRVKETVDDLEWLNENGYRFLLPSGMENRKDAQVEVVRKSVESEYDRKPYLIAEEAILKSWNGNSGLMKRINEKMRGSSSLNELTVILTRYGTQGSYLMPNSAIINISKVPPEFLIKTVVHESLHLMIENLIRRYLVKHWVKERVVDLITDIEFKSRFKMQTVPAWALATDAIFKEHYPDLILVTEKAAKISPESSK